MYKVCKTPHAELVNENKCKFVATTFLGNEISQGLSKRRVCFRPSHRLAMNRSVGRVLSVGTKTFKSTKEPP